MKCQGCRGFKHTSSQGFVNSDWNFSQPKKLWLHTAPHTQIYTKGLFLFDFLFGKNNELAPPSPAIPDFQQHPQRELDKIFRANPPGCGELIYGRGFECIKGFLLLHPLVFLSWCN